MDIGRVGIRKNTSPSFLIAFVAIARRIVNARLSVQVPTPSDSAWVVRRGDVVRAYYHSYHF